MSWCWCMKLSKRILETRDSLQSRSYFFFWCFSVGVGEIPPHFYEVFGRYGVFLSLFSFGNHTIYWFSVCLLDLINESRNAYITAYVWRVQSNNVVFIVCPISPKLAKQFQRIFFNFSIFTTISILSNCSTSGFEKMIYEQWMSTAVWL